MSGLLSRVTVTTVGLTCKLFLNTGFTSITVNGLPTLMDALTHSKRGCGQGVVTVSNHISTLDDPVTWGILPASYFLNSRMIRWALGASDIMFTNPLFSTFFRLGQTLETFRGKGVHQPAVDIAIAKLNQGNWVHLYGEGKVNQPATYPKNIDGVVQLPRFKWGVGRILMEASIPPVIIPMWLTGFDTLMPEGRAFPYKYFPRPGARLSVTFGSPIPTDEIQAVIDTLGISNHVSHPHKMLTGWTDNQVTQELDQNRSINDCTSEILKVRAEVTAIVQRSVESLGKSVRDHSTK